MATTALASVTALMKKKSQESFDGHPDFVDAGWIASRLSVCSRYVLQMADEERIPCLRLGAKCVRFSPDEVAEKLGIKWKKGVRSDPPDRSA